MGAWAPGCGRRRGEDPGSALGGPPGAAEGAPDTAALPGRWVSAGGGGPRAHPHPCCVPTSSAQEAPELDMPGKERQERSRVRIASESLDEEDS